MPHKLIHGINGCEVIVDPLGEYEDKQPTDLIEACGLLPSILCITEGDSFKERAENGYQFFYGWRVCGTKRNASVDNDGVYSYPQDTDLYPLMSFAKNGETAWVYEYGLVVVSDPDLNGKYLTTRMD